jgi:branched-chain amino acid transport system permease protein
VLASFGVQEVLSGLFLNLTDLTGGSAGLRGIPRPSIFGWPIQTNLRYLLLYAVIVGVALLLFVRLVRSPFGLMLRAIREDELVPQALGKDIVATKVKAFAASGGAAGLAGALYAHYMTFISPESFDVHVSIFILSMVLVGGMGSIYGPLLGAALLVTLPELLRFMPMSSTELGPMRQIVYGAILVAFCFARPRGLVGSRGGAE